MKADFSGYATKAGLKCSDGRTITSGAFKHQDQQRVPLVWQHGHSDPENVLGHAILEHREDGVYAYCFFNPSAKAEHAKTLVEHGDISMLSIWANQLIERGGQVLHGAIREVSLVLSGANPGALIENITLRHSDDDDEVLEGEAIIYSGEELEHSDLAHAEEDDESDEEDEEEEDEEEDEDEETVQDIYDSLSDKQKDVVHYMIGEVLSASEKTLKQDNTEDTPNTDPEGTKEMKHNVFESQGTADNAPVISHDDMKQIVNTAARTGSLKHAVEEYALAHGITDIEVLFPDAQNVSNVPEWIKRRTEWVESLLGSVRKSPFSRIKTISADITFDEARAKGYVKGDMKKEEFFGVQARSTTPTTIYKKQALDRDDVVDITDFDVVAWLKAEMRLMLDEELGRAILIGDGRDVASDEKINEGNIRPIAKDHELYTTTVNVNVEDNNSSMTEVVDAVIMNRYKLKGTGMPNFYTTEYWIARFMLLRDADGHRIYKTLGDLAAELRVANIVAVEAMMDEPGIIGIIVNPVDYVLGADKGGQVAMFDDFDIDYNKQKYLIETRVSGALVKVKSAMVVRSMPSNAVLVKPEAPSFVASTGVITIPTVTGVTYKRADTDATVSAGAMTALAPGESLTIYAVPASASYYFATSDDDTWTFTRPL
jgi:hypothetical protein